MRHHSTIKNIRAAVGQPKKRRDTPRHASGGGGYNDNTTAAKKTKAKIAIITMGTSMIQTISIPSVVMIQMITAIATTMMPG
jgi:hypothetical protein